MTWPTRRAKFVFRRRDVRGADAPLASATMDGVFLRENLGQAVWNPGEDVAGYKLVEPDDFVIGLRSFQHGLSHSMVRGLVSPAYTVLRADEHMEPRYFKYYFRSGVFVSRLSNLAQGIRQGKTIDYEEFSNLEVPVPSVEEQLRVADFLDAKTAGLDRLITVMREQLETIESRRRGVLDRAWRAGGTTVRLGYKVALITSGPRGWGDYLDDEGTLFVRSANLRRDSIQPNLGNLAHVTPPRSAEVEAARSRIRAGDVLVGITGANTGWVALVTPDMVGGNVSQHVCLVRPALGIDANWLAYILSSDRTQSFLLRSQYGGTKTQLSLPDIRDLRIPVCEQGDQVAIATTIDGQLDDISEMRRYREAQLALLAERRQSLVTAAVTGQLDVTTARSGV